jgi:pSer/pThr/pTyr-binding forkhead associated (FHA) protein
MSGSILLVLRVILVMALYGFLAWALLTLWQELRSQSQILVPRTPPILTLLYQLEDETRSLRFQTPEITIGRDPASDFSVDDRTVSAQHARLCFRQGQWWVEDLNSTNGTYLNDEPVSAPLVVTSGDQVRCGQVSLDITVGELSEDGSGEMNR